MKLGMDVVVNNQSNKLIEVYLKIKCTLRYKYIFISELTNNDFMYLKDKLFLQMYIICRYTKDFSFT